jgi:hypothetical protein
MKKRLAVAMMAFSLASGFLSFGQRNDNKMADEPLLSCPEECCTSEQADPEEKCCKDTEMCSE